MLLTREQPRTPAFLPSAPLPSLTRAFSRRAAIFGTVTVTGALADVVARTATSSPDAWLIEIGEDMAAADRAVDVLVAANPDGWENDPAWQALTARFHALFREMERMPAITMDGLNAKARALQIPWVAEEERAVARLGTSLAADVRHLCAGTPTIS